MKKTCLIIDDEPLARKRLSAMVTEVPRLLLLGECKTGKEAISKIKSLKPDLVLLDIQMKDMSGFDVLKKLKVTERPLVIFVTAFDTYAVKAFEYLAFDYLLKPFKRDRFLQSITRAFEHFELENNASINTKIETLFSYLNTVPENNTNEFFKNKLPIKTGNSVSFIDAESIRYVTASGSYIDIITKEKTFVHRSSLNKLMEQLSNDKLIRIHRSTVINLNFIDKVIHSSYGEIDVKMKDDSIFRISKSYRKKFQHTIGI